MIERILRLIPSYRKLELELEITNRDLSVEIAEKNKLKRKCNTLELERDELINRCYDAITVVSSSRLAKDKKERIEMILRGIK